MEKSPLLDDGSEKLDNFISFHLNNTNSLLARVVIFYDEITFRYIGVRTQINMKDAVSINFSSHSSTWKEWTFLLLSEEKTFRTQILAPPYEYLRIGCLIDDKGVLSVVTLQTNHRDILFSVIYWTCNVPSLNSFSIGTKRQHKN